jgi:hypothetical protein
MARDSQLRSESSPLGLKREGVSGAVVTGQTKLTKGQFPIRVMSRKGMFSLKQDDVLLPSLVRSSESSKVVYETTDVFLCGKVVDGHGGDELLEVDGNGKNIRGGRGISLFGFASQSRLWPSGSRADHRVQEHLKFMVRSPCIL